MNRRRLRAASLAGLLWLASGAVAAMGLQVAPISLTIKPSQPAQGLWLSNTGSSKLKTQVRVYRWTQSGFEGQQLTLTQALVISPPMATLRPGERQLLRVIRTGPPPTGKQATEQAYRLIINELPDANNGPKKPDSQRPAGLNFIVKYSVPVFVVPAHAGETLKAELHWRLRASNGQVVLIGSNSGSKHDHISRIRFITPGGRTILIEDGLFGYVLPHATRKWKLDIEAQRINGGWRLRARINDQSRTMPIEVRRTPH